MRVAGAAGTSAPEPGSAARGTSSRCGGFRISTSGYPVRDGPLASRRRARYASPFVAAARPPSAAAVRGEPRAMPVIINVNGRITGEAEAAVSPLDHGFLYGEGVYEVVRTYGRSPFLFDRHMERLRGSAGRIAMALPFDHGEFERCVRETCDAFWAQPDASDEVYIRILVTRGVGDISYNPAACHSPTVVIIVKPLQLPPPEVYEAGVRVAIAGIIRNHPGSVSPRIKSNNLLNNALAAQEAYRLGAFEAIMRNYRNEISEGSISTVFVVKDGAVTTPPLDAGLLAGITRAFVLEVAPAAGVTIRENVLQDADLFGADECFLTSSTQEIIPVVRVDDATIGNGRPGPVTKRLHAEYRRRVAELTRGWGAAAAGTVLE
ncbi:MAG: aminotransferase [Acidobacteria bacterium]|nr:MAG: aminotransferase [Acidobacteriota bacterium]